MIRVFIVAESDDRTAALAAMLEEDLRFESTALAQADVILCAGVPLQRLPRRGKPLVFISAEADGDAPLDDVLKAWLPASATAEQIASAVAAAAAGFTLLTKAQARRILQPSQTPDDSLFEEALTPREREVLLMMAAGSGNKTIAQRLRISPNTAKFHVAQIMAKLGAASRTEAVTLAIRRGMVPI